MRLPGLWGFAGVLALIAQAVHRLTPHAIEAVTHRLTVLQLSLLVGWVGVNAYAEGWRGFHRMFAPRVVARAQALDEAPRPWLVALAPFYCMGLVHATRKRLIVSWILTLGIVVVVVVVREVDQPWRGIIDAGVVVGLAIGMLSMLYYFALALRGERMPVAPDLPGQEGG